MATIVLEWDDKNIFGCRVNFFLLKWDAKDISGVGGKNILKGRWQNHFQSGCQTIYGV